MGDEKEAEGHCELKSSKACLSTLVEPGIAGTQYNWLDRVVSCKEAVTYIDLMASPQSDEKIVLYLHRRNI
eukprot:scaffold30237_cov19-Prasinocladus_malaysianus.AAC.1